MDKELQKNEFFWDSIKEGVERNKRRDALIWLFHYLMEYEYPEYDDPLTLILYWNRLNRPPLHPEDVANIYRDLYKNCRVLTFWKSAIRKKIFTPITLGAWFPDAQGHLL